MIFVLLHLQIDLSQQAILHALYSVHVLHCHFMLFILQAEDGTIVNWMRLGTDTI